MATASLNLQHYDFDLPKWLIAQYPVTFRDHCRLLVHHRDTRTNEHRRFYDLPEYLKSGDVLVFNNTRVLASRCYFFRSTGGKVEVFFLKSLTGNKFEALLRGKAKCGETLSCQGITVQLIEKQTGGHWILEASHPPLEWIEILGKPPLPPYIKRAKENDSSLLKDQENYQTVFAKKAGAIASPTAGLHFTESLLKELESQGVELISITLHVGLGTFQPIEAIDVREHKMHEEWYCIEEDSKARLLKAKKEGRRIFTVGTTSTRTLESAGGQLEKMSGETEIFIYPPYDFQWVDGLITNFHLPKTTLLLLVAAIMGHDALIETYQEAIEHRYRFYSYGDGMLIL